MHLLQSGYTVTLSECQMLNLNIGKSEILHIGHLRFASKNNCRKFKQVCEYLSTKSTSEISLSNKSAMHCTVTVTLVRAQQIGKIEYTRNIFRNEVQKNILIYINILSFFTFLLY